MREREWVNAFVRGGGVLAGISVFLGVRVIKVEEKQGKRRVNALSEPRGKDHLMPQIIFGSR